MATPSFDPSVITTEINNITTGVSNITTGVAKCIEEATLLVTELPLELAQLVTYVGSTDWTSLLPNPFVAFPSSVDPPETPEGESCPDVDIVESSYIMQAIGFAINGVMGRLYNKADEFLLEVGELFTDKQYARKSVSDYLKELYYNINSELMKILVEQQKQIENDYYANGAEDNEDYLLEKSTDVLNEQNAFIRLWNIFVLNFLTRWNKLCRTFNKLLDDFDEFCDDVGDSIDNIRDAIDDWTNAVSCVEREKKSIKVSPV